VFKELGEDFKALKDSGALDYLSFLKTKISDSTSSNASAPTSGGQK
jgi:hypothetical protein